ncbi:TetR/AcrR family transcriptional regulator [Marinicrinis lubricantis]|uniref:TetR/AcrR family transcriptional regulator n=1 Tax=Marinicrinis lubricantis TaxID=2086470 RepID=A0ABW1IQU6_9BACL
MQTLKPEMKTAILQQAKKQFLQLGYERVTMKSIASAVNMSVGNLYRYFENKDRLFEAVVKPAIDGLTHLLNHHEEPDDAEQASAAVIISAVGELLGELLQNVAEELLILVDGSKGTPFEHMPDQLYTALTEHLEKHLVKDGKQKEWPDPSLVSKPVAVGFLQGFFEIARCHRSDPERMRQAAEDYFRIQFNGLQAVF